MDAPETEPVLATPVAEPLPGPVPASRLAGLGASEIRAELARRERHARRLLARRERVLAAIAQLDERLAAAQRDLQHRARQVEAKVRGRSRRRRA